MGSWGFYDYPIEPEEDEAYWLERMADEESFEEFVERERERERER